MFQSRKNSFLNAAGGKWFLDTRFLLLTTPVVITTSLLTTSSQYLSMPDIPASSWSVYGRIFLANIFALALCALWIFLFSMTLFKNRSQNAIPLPVVVFFSASVGLLKGAGTGLGSWLLQLDSDLPSTILSRVGQTTLLGTWLLPAIALVGHRLSILQAQREALVAERVSNTLIESGEAQTRDNQAALRAFAAMAKKELSTINNTVGSAEPTAQYALAIRRLVTDQLRPLSHRIWDQENKRISSFSISEISRKAIFSFTSARIIVAAVYAVTAFPSIIRFVPLGEAVLRSILAAAVIYFGFLAASLWKPKKYWPASIWFFTSVLLVASLTFVTGELVFGFIAEFNAFETVLAVWLWLTQLTFMSTFLSGVRDSGSEIKQEFAELYGSESIDRAVRLSQARIQNRDFANYLHGQVQNRLLSVALGLEKGEATKEELEQALALVEDILKSLDSNFKTMNTGEIDLEIAKINAQWMGFLSINWQMDKEIHYLESRQKILLIQVIDEAISNAVRHGLAKNVNVVAKIVADSALQLQVFDDGIGPRDGKAGLGSTFFGSVSKGDWSLTQEPNGGSKLTLKF